MTVASKSTLATVVRRAVSQHNTLCNQQLRELGVGRTWVAEHVQNGLFTPVDAGVFVLGLDIGELPRDTCAMVAVLRNFGRSALAFESAAERLGIWTRGPDDIHVAATSRTSSVLRGLAPDISIHTHRTRCLDVNDVVFVHRMPTTCALRTITDLGTRLTEHQLAHVIWNALYAELIDIPSLQRYLDAKRRVPGTAAARDGLRWVEAGACGTKSTSEDEVVDLIVRMSLPPPLVNLMGATGLPGVRLDFVWKEQRVVFELDGRHHAAMPGIARNDRAVFAALQAAGWTTLRAHYSRVWSDPAGIATMLMRALDR